MPDDPPVISAARSIPRTVNRVEATLTGLTAGGGCAAKYSAARLEELLKGFVPVEAENLLVGLSPADDAAVYKLDDERALVFTLDFFPPLVDDHTIRDAEPKYGLAVIGTVHPKGIWPKSGARAGDALFLTKPLGTGLVLAGLGKGLAGDDQLAEAVGWMTTLNGAADDVLRPFQPNAVTDVTGFGLLGHAHEMADRSGVRILIDADALPSMDGALHVAHAGVRTGGDPRNRDFAAPHVTSDGIADTVLALAYDPQTAGGLLISLPADKALSLQAEFHARELFLRRIGSVEDGAGVVIS